MPFIRAFLQRVDRSAAFLIDINDVYSNRNLPAV